MSGERPIRANIGIHHGQEKMHLLDQRILGSVILFLLGLLVIVKQWTTGRILDNPTGNLLVRGVNIFNLFFLLVVNPLAAILLISRLLEALDPTHVTIVAPWLWMVLEILGSVVYGSGYILMAWALIRLGRYYQLGGSAPRPEDSMVMDGPYRLVRHPMYTAALSISLGLACLIQSWGAICVFCIYLGLILLLIPTEEAGLRRAYGDQYSAYERKTRKLIPFIY